MIGRVISAKTKNTVTVNVERKVMHPLYKKTYVQTKKYLADAGNDIKEGALVEIVKVRPISKNKHFRVAKVIGKDLAEITKEQLKAEAEGIIAEIMPQEKEESHESKEKEGKEREVVMDNSAVKTKSTKGGKDRIAQK